MSSPKMFATESQNATLVVIPLASISSFAGDHVQPELDRLLALLAQDTVNSVVVDFAHVSYLGSVMLATTQMLWKRGRARQKKLVLCNVSEVGREVLRVSNFDQIWPVYASREEALKALAH
jgi:anti-sigma B factor antagonist